MVLLEWEGIFSRWKFYVSYIAIRRHDRVKLSVEAMKIKNTNDH